MNQVQELERAILARAERLATEYRERAARSRDAILREASERLRLREAREEAIAKSLGDRAFRQRVQASELKMQSHLDRVRWNLVQDVEGSLPERMRQFIGDEQAYGHWLEALIRAAASAIERDEILVTANSRDLKRLRTGWDAIVQALPTGRRATLSDEPIEALAGVLVTSADGRIRVDNTFEGRLERLRPRVQQVILERLLPSGFDTGSIFSG